MNYEILPSLNAFLNGCAGVLLVLGYWMISQKKVGAHKTAMLSAFGVSTAFLISYLAHHAHAGHVRYQGTGLWRPVYFTILITHTILAVAIVPMILRTLYLALKGRFDDHRAVARWTFPFWLYVSATGVVIYVMVY